MSDALDADLYQRVQQFYAEHMRLLDEGRADEWAAGFTEDGEFAQDKRPEPRRGREVIAAGLRATAAKLAERGVVRRHWIGMLSVHPQDDATVRTRFYALVIETPAGGQPVLHLSTDCADVLVPDGAGWLIRHRRVHHDGR